MTFKEKHEFEKLEKEMPALEKEKEKLTAALSDETLNYDQITSLADSLTKVTITLEEMELRWLELSEMAE
jgi:ATP-binding cassette subfamily F protein uup